MPVHPAHPYEPAERPFGLPSVARVGVVGGAGPLGELVADAFGRRGVDVVALPSRVRRSLDAVVILPDDDALDGSATGIGAVDLAAARSALADAPRVVVAVSTALVYGAATDAPLPLTETAVLRPVQSCASAVRAAELERMVMRPRADLHTDVHADPYVRRVVLRPCLVVGDDEPSRLWWTRSQWAHSARRGVHAPPLQLLWRNDLAAAIVHATAELDGPFNVAPAGWLSAPQQRELIGGLVTASLSSRTGRILGRAAVSLGWRSGGLSTPSDAAAYLDAPWVVASDRLRATGWEPVASNEEALLLVDPPPRFDDVPARRRQEIVLGAAAGLMGTAAAGAAAAWRSNRRRR